MSEDLQAWVGRRRQQTTYLTGWPAEAMHGVLDLGLKQPTENLPGLWHWLYFLEVALHSKIGHDGHPQKGDFLPPVPNPRRMFAGARTQYHAPLILNESAELVETVVSINQKEGAQGTLYIVTVDYEYSQRGQVCVSEQRDFIYLPAVASSAVNSAVATGIDTDYQTLADADWWRDVATDPVRLMRFSALTFNSHRVHYDAGYACFEEGYPGLVVHGPLTAIFLSELCRANSDAPLSSFSFRAKAPLFCGQTIRLRGNCSGQNVELIAWRPDGKAAVSASATFKQQVKT